MIIKHVHFYVIITLIWTSIFLLGRFNHQFTDHIYTQNNTDIYIICGNDEKTGWFTGPCKTDFLKALAEKMPHIFITPNVWSEYCMFYRKAHKQLQNMNVKHPQQELEIKGQRLYKKQKDGKTIYMPKGHNIEGLATVLAFDQQEWEFYRTPANLYYLKLKGAPDIGLKMHNFTQIEYPCKMNVPKTGNINWVDDFIALFDLERWNLCHAGRKKHISILGHGSKRSTSYKREKACGLKAPDFARLITFFDEQLNIDLLGIQTCHWTAERILQLIKHNGKQHLSCHLITPIDKERTVKAYAEMPVVHSYNAEKKDIVLQTSSMRKTISGGLRDLCTCYNGNLTDEVLKQIDQIDVVHLNHSYAQKTSLIDAGTTIIKTV